MTTIDLAWKEFSVNLDKVRDFLKTNLTANYDGLLADEQKLSVIFFDTPSDGDASVVSVYWASLTNSSFNPTLREIVSGKINSAVEFGSQLIVTAAVDNVLLGITQANKTRIVSDYCSSLQGYLRTGSLYAAVQEIDILLADTGRDAALAPFITNDRLNDYKARIEAFLA